MKGTTITAKWENLNDGAADLVTEVLHGLVHAVRSGHVHIEGSKETAEPAAEPAAGVDCLCDDIGNDLCHVPGHHKRTL